jgi:hypothetical protein
LGIAQAHFAGCMGRDVAELAASRPDVVSSLTLVCPWGLKIAAPASG